MYRVAIDDVPIIKWNCFGLCVIWYFGQIILDGGLTTHSAFKFPLNIQFATAQTCNILKRYGEGTSTFKLIVWNKTLWQHSKLLEALDRIFKDLLEQQQSHLVKLSFY